MTSSNKYLIGAKLGKGAFGAVYLAFDIGTARHVAAKEVSIEDPKALAKARDEFDMLRRLTHPHIVQVIDFEVLEDAARIYMEWMPGGMP